MGGYEYHWSFCEGFLGSDVYFGGYCLVGFDQML